MCGFVAIVTPTGKSIAPAVLREMTERLAHRGPDDFGYACVDPQTSESQQWTTHCPRPELSGVLLGHRRLSILDLGQGGHQPMFNDDRSMVLAYNGEIYNFVELRAELQSRGVAFSSRSDTEVLLKAYEYWGPAALDKFNGMWAFALWDGRERKLIASRDRFGVKPLYYTRVDGTWLFASEIKALMAFPGAFRGFRSDGVQAFLERTTIDCDERTFFDEVFAVPPGSYVVVDGDTAIPRRFWSLQIDDRHRGASRESLVAQFGDLLNDSVRLRVRSDVPIGTMLSGGLDSTSITALIDEQRLRQSTSTTQESAGIRDFHHTITACWPGWFHDEEAQVDALCAKLGLASHKRYLTPEAMAGVLQEVAYHLEEPFENATALVQYLLMKQAKAIGITVVLNGHGSDEALAGYPNQFVPLFLAAQLLDGHPIRLVREMLAFRATMGWTVREGVEQAARAIKPARAAAHYLPNSTARDARSTHWGRRTGAVVASRGMSALNTELWKNFSTYVLPRWLRMEDRMSMAASVESRLPFMDYRLVEFAFNVPDDMKLRDGYTKAILRDAMRTRLPDAIVLDRVKKRFASPFASWLRGPWRATVEDVLNGPCVLDDHVDMSAFRRGLQAFLAGGSDGADSQRIWRTFNAELCLRTFAGEFAAHAPFA